jgi:hypothetical protein
MTPVSPLLSGVARNCSKQNEAKETKSKIT